MIRQTCASPFFIGRSVRRRGWDYHGGMRRQAVTVLLALCVLLGGCPESTHPASDPAAAAHDARLFGTWRGTFEGDEVYLHVAPAARGLTGAVMVERKQKGGDLKIERYAAFPSRAGSLTVLNVRPLDADSERGYSLFRYEVDADRLTLWMTSFNVVREDIRAGRLTGIAQPGQLGETRITASTAELSAWLGAADSKRLFDKPLAFRAVVAPVTAVVPPAEHDKAQRRKSRGPAANSGIESVKVLGTVPLAGEVEGAGGRVLRARELLIAPGGVVAVHQHDQRPGVAYILEGEMTEFRGEKAEPIVHKAGSTALEWSGVTHWWENRSDKPARALVVDIVPAP
jgi:quercetin dioxygenase-like cupin family protein